MSSEFSMMIYNIKSLISGHDINSYKAFVVTYITYALLTESVCKKKCYHNMTCMDHHTNFFKTLKNLESNIHEECKKAS